MMANTYRPAGPLLWTHERLAVGKWSVLGCLATEERCLAVWHELCSKGLVAEGVFVEVKNPPSRFAQESNRLVLSWREQLLKIGKPSHGIVNRPLFCLSENIVNFVDEFLNFCTEDVIIDISCLPKRFFFPFVHRLLDSGIRNLIVTYTVPEHYFEGDLAEDHEPLAPLPLFGQRTFPDRKVKIAIVGVGFMPLGLRELLQPYSQNVDIKILLPFPSGSSDYMRNWEFLRHLVTGIEIEGKDVIRVNAHDVSDVFDHVSECTNKGGIACVFAPFGPKTVSLAMCLFSRLTQSPVLYTQPRVYHPQYSTGVNRIEAYCLRVDGRNLYFI